MKIINDCILIVDHMNTAYIVKEENVIYKK